MRYNQRDSKGRFCKKNATSTKKYEQLTFRLNVHDEKEHQEVNFSKIARGLSSEEKSRIRGMHKAASKLLTMIDTMASFLESYSTDCYARRAAKAAICTLNNQLEKLEFAMQKAWGIKQDANYHTWWLRPNHCTCPKIDNCDPLYFGSGKIINATCPVHGNTEEC